MTLDEFTPEAVALMAKLRHNPQPVEDSALLQLLLADRILMGSTNMAHLTRSGGRLLAAYRLLRWTRPTDRMLSMERQGFRAIGCGGACSPMTAP